MTEWFIPGEPPTWLGSGERDWKARLAEAVKLAPAPFLNLDFRVSSFLRAGHRFDLDNMVTPVFDQLLGPRRSELRRALHGWSARRGLSPQPGLRIVEADSARNDSMGGEDCLVLDLAYLGGLPADSRGKGVEFAQAVVHALGAWSPSAEHRFAVDLGFGDDVQDITWVAEKPVKPVVDCLFPVLGGRPGAPEDWKIERLRVQRGLSDLRGAFSVKVWALSSPGEAPDRPPALPQTVQPHAAKPNRQSLPRASQMTNFDRLDAAAKALGSPPATIRLGEVLARAASMFPEMAAVGADSAAATMDFQTMNVRGRASKPGDFKASARWNRSPAFLKVGPGVWRRLSDAERAALAKLWVQGAPLLRKPEFDASEWDRLVGSA